MCRVITPDHLDCAVEFSWKLCGDMKQRSYPLYRSRPQMLQEYRWSVEHENGELVGWFEKEELRGILCYYWLPEDSYVQTTGFYIASAGESGEPYRKIADAFLSYLEHKFPDYEINIGIPAENRRAAETLAAHGFTVAEASHDMRLAKEDFRKLSALHEIIRIDETNFDQYAEFHDSHFQNIYWNVARLCSQIKEWDIFAIRDGQNIGMTRGDGSPVLFCKKEHRQIKPRNKTPVEEAESCIHNARGGGNMDSAAEQMFFSAVCKALKNEDAEIRGLCTSSGSLYSKQHNGICCLYETTMVYLVLKQLMRDHFSYELWWECPYPNNPALKADLAVLENNPERSINSLVEFKIWISENGDEVKGDVAKYNQSGFTSDKYLCVVEYGGSNIQANLAYLIKSNPELRLVSNNTWATFSTRFFDSHTTGRLVDKPINLYFFKLK